MSMTGRQNGDQNKETGKMENKQSARKEDNHYNNNSEDSIGNYRQR